MAYRYLSGRTGYICKADGNVGNTIYEMESIKDAVEEAKQAAENAQYASESARDAIESLG